MSSVKPNQQFACIILASGKSTRFEGHKLLSELAPSNTVLACTIAKYSQVFEILILIESESVSLNYIEDNPNLLRVMNTSPHKGLSHSIKLGVELSIEQGNKLGKQFDGYVIALADMPLVKTQTLFEITQLAAQVATNTKPFIVAPEYQSKRGHPVCFSSDFNAALTALSNDRGAKDIIRNSHQYLHLLKTQDEGVLFDIDTLEDLAEAKNRLLGSI